jgi:hypothetical protein
LRVRGTLFERSVEDVDTLGGCSVGGGRGARMPGIHGHKGIDDSRGTDVLGIGRGVRRGSPNLGQAA